MVRMRGLEPPRSCEHYSPRTERDWKAYYAANPDDRKRVDKETRKNIPLDDEAIHAHLSGKQTVGVYPLLLDDTCWFLAADFDKKTWKEDAAAFRETCSTLGVPASVECSRSGDGAHIWIFFERPVSAGLARRLGSLLLTRTMERRHQLGLDSYDRLFPNQDTMPRGGFGNLIALPLQKVPREQGRSVFLDGEMQPYPDQWAYLGSVKRMAQTAAERLISDPLKDHPKVRLLFRFWNAARRGARDPLFVSTGMAGPDVDVTAPVAAYRHHDVHPSGHTAERLILMQHGSYHIGEIESQPRVEQGEAVLYRGVQKSETYVLHRLTTAEIRRRVMAVHARSLTDSVASFNAAHCNLMRCETGYLNDGSFLFDGLCQEAGLDPDAPPIRSVIYFGYALEEWCASRKFGPNYVKFRTPLTNVRITTFVAGETDGACQQL